MKKKSLLITAIMGVVFLLALSFVTCDLDFLNPNVSKGGEEYLDWEFVDAPNGTAQLTVWLDGSSPVPAKTANRALNLGIAKRSHDLFEAVFIADGGLVARTNWEVGQAAGIRGVQRGNTYYSVNRSDVDGSSKTGASIILVGRKTGNNGEGTLLGVGFMTHVDGKLIANATDGVVAPTTKNVTFTVSAISTRVGYDFSLDDALITESWFPVGTTPSAITSYDSNYAARDTFYTAARNPAGTPSFADTLIGTATFKNNATFSMFGLPRTTGSALVTTVPAIYKVGGLNVTAADIAKDGGIAAYVNASGVDLSKALFIADCSPEPNFQVIERLGIYQTLGQTYDVIEADLDIYTTVTPAAAYPTAAGSTFDPSIQLNFIITKDSAGAFAFTFQVPVWGLAPAATSGTALLPAGSTNGGPEAIYWYIRPAHGQPQYLLDNGYSAAGGAVLMGVGVGSLDWLSIIVRGFGFTNTPNR